MHNLLSCIVLSAVILVIVGCGPELSKQDLGTVVFQMPKISDTSEPKPESSAKPSKRAAQEKKPIVKSHVSPDEAEPSAPKQ
jgi:hypothetical protein